MAQFEDARRRWYEPARQVVARPERAAGIDPAPTPRAMPPFDRRPVAFHPAVGIAHSGVPLRRHAGEAADEATSTVQTAFCWSGLPTIRQRRRLTRSPTVPCSG